MRDIGKNIREARENRGLTQDQLADKLFVTRQTVSNYENGKSRPDIDMLEKIAAVLDTDMNCLIYGTSKSGGPKLAIKIIAIITGAILIVGETAKDLLLVIAHTKYALKEGLIAPSDIAKSEIHFRLTAISATIDRFMVWFFTAGLITLFILCFFMEKQISWKKKLIYSAIILGAAFLIRFIMSLFDPVFNFIHFSMSICVVTVTLIICLIVSITCDELRKRKKA